MLFPHRAYTDNITFCEVNLFHVLYVKMTSFTHFPAAVFRPPKMADTHSSENARDFFVSSSQMKFVNNAEMDLMMSEIHCLCNIHSYTSHFNI